MKLGFLIQEFHSEDKCVLTCIDLLHKDKIITKVELDASENICLRQSDNKFKDVNTKQLFAKLAKDKAHILHTIADLISKQSENIKFRIVEGTHGKVRILNYKIDYVKKFRHVKRCYTIDQEMTRSLLQGLLVSDLAFPYEKTRAYVTYMISPDLGLITLTTELFANITQVTTVVKYGCSYIRKGSDEDFLDLAFSVTYKVNINLVREILSILSAPDFKYSRDVIEQFNVWSVVGWFIGDGVVNVIERGRVAGDREIRLGLSIGVKDRSVLNEIASCLSKILGNGVKVVDFENKIYFVKDAKTKILKHTYQLFSNLPKFLWPRKIHRLMNIISCSRYYSWLRDQIELGSALTLEDAVKLLSKHIHIRYRGNYPYVQIYGLKSNELLRKAYELIRNKLGISKSLEHIRNRTLELSGTDARKLISLLSRYSTKVKTCDEVTEL